MWEFPNYSPIPLFWESVVTLKEVMDKHFKLYYRGQGSEHPMDLARLYPSVVSLGCIPRLYPSVMIPIAQRL